MVSRFHIQKWSYWMSDGSAFANGKGVVAPTVAELALPEVPAMQRRRLSRLSRMALRAAFDAAGDRQLPSVFCSRHGELHRTMELFDQLCKQEPLSPMGFAQSVHNTSSGLYAIITANTQPSTLITAGPATLMMGFIEAAAYSQASGSPVLLVHADEPLPNHYRPFADEVEQELALAFVIDHACDPSQPHWQLQHSPLPQPAAPTAALATQLTANLLADNHHFTCRHGTIGWEWRYGQS